MTSSTVGAVLHSHSHVHQAGALPTVSAHRAGVHERVQMPSRLTAFLPRGVRSECWPKLILVGAGKKPKRVAVAHSAMSNTEGSVRQGVSKEVAEKLASLGGMVTDEAVPEGHKGLHGFLYGDGGAEVHDGGRTFVGRPTEEDGTTVMGLDDWITPREAQRAAGVYGVYDDEGVLQYVGFSRNIVLSLRQFRGRLGESKTASVRVKVVTDREMLTRAKLETERDRWLFDLVGENLPIGNAEQKELWEGTSDGTTSVVAMTEEERVAYEETKLKLRKAMGENLYDDVEGEDLDSKTRRLNLLRAVEGDDWSSVIDGQTKGTLEGVPDTPALASDSERGEKVVEGGIISPFARPRVSENGPPPVSSSMAEISLELNHANVDKVLDEVRPYLIADGGNVEVVSVEAGVVSLRLQGACGTCSSSTATMKMGIEKTLQDKFGDGLKEVVQVDKQDVGATVESVNSHLDMLRPAIANYGGEVEVLAVDRERRSCEVRYKGPAPIGMGIQAAIRDKFPDIVDVNLVDA